MTSYAMPDYACHPCQVEWAETAGTSCWMCGQPGDNTWQLQVHETWANAVTWSPQIESKIVAGFATAKVLRPVL